MSSSQVYFHAGAALAVLAVNYKAVPHGLPLPLFTEISCHEI